MAAGPASVRRFWLKRITHLHPRLQKFPEEGVQSGNGPDWRTKGMIVLVQKDPTKGTQILNYHPIAGLPLMWNLLIGIIGEKLYLHLERNELLAKEQKGCRKRSRGTKDQLIIDKAILKNCWRRLTNLFMAWIDYSKMFDVVLYSWRLKCLNMVDAARNITTLINNSMTNWKTVLTSGGIKIGQADIKKGVFKGE